jgi:NACalpha-BTF3-like transcription factor
MSCREFAPGLDKFCSDPKDFVNPRQIVQMATHFGMKRTELKKVELMAVREESTRLSVAVAQSVLPS